MLRKNLMPYETTQKIKQAVLLSGVRQKHFRGTPHSLHDGNETLSVDKDFVYPALRL